MLRNDVSVAQETILVRTGVTFCVVAINSPFVLINTLKSVMFSLTWHIYLLRYN